MKGHNRSQKREEGQAAFLWRAWKKGSRRRGENSTICALRRGGADKGMLSKKALKDDQKKSARMP